MKEVERMTLTGEFVDRALGEIRGDRYFLVPEHYPPHSHDTVLIYLGYYGGIPHLKMLSTDRDIPSGIELRLYPRMDRDSISLGFTTLDGERVSITVDSLVNPGDVVTFEFDLPSEVS